MEGLKERKYLSANNRKIINDEIGLYILSERKKLTSYDDISNQIRFLFKKKITSRSISNWVSEYNKSNENKNLNLPAQQEVDFGQEFFVRQEEDKWCHNSYAGSLILYSIIGRTGLLKIFEENIWDRR